MKTKKSTEVILPDWPQPICGRCGKPRSAACGDDFIPMPVVPDATTDTKDADRQSLRKVMDEIPRYFPHVPIGHGGDADKAWQTIFAFGKRCLAIAYEHAEKDAARYRYVRSQPNINIGSAWILPVCAPVANSPEELDVAIDTALANPQSAGAGDRVEGEGV